MLEKIYKSKQNTELRMNQTINLLNSLSEFAALFTLHYSANRLHSLASSQAPQTNQTEWREHVTTRTRPNSNGNRSDMFVIKLYQSIYAARACKFTANPAISKTRLLSAADNWLVRCAHVIISLFMTIT